jgi:hypothetical protein
MPAMTPELSVVLPKAAKLGFKTELRDKRTVYIDGTLTVDPARPSSRNGMRIFRAAMR